MYLKNMGRNLLIIFLVLCCQAIEVSSASEEYVLGAGDVISITVFNESDMSISNVRIPKSGFVTFPYIGDIKATDVTLKTLKKRLIKQLKDGYLKKPQLVISIDEYRKFFINGQVKSPGGYPYVEGLTVRKAISIAGGLTDRASMAKASILREGKKKPEKLIGSIDRKMGPGDVLTIGESLF